MNEKIEVMGARQEPLFKWLRDKALNGGDMDWNFEKFLINPQGELIGYWQSGVEPDSCLPEICKCLEKNKNSML